MRVAWAAVLGALAFAVGAAPLPGGFPPLQDPTRLAAWLEGVGPVSGLYGGVRVAVVATLAVWAGVLVLRSIVAGTQLGAVLAGHLVERAAAGGRRAGLGGLLRLVLGLSAPGVVTAGCSIGSAGGIHASVETASAAGVGSGAGSGSASGGGTGIASGAGSGPSRSLPAPVLIGPPAPAPGPTTRSVPAPVPAADPAPTATPAAAGAPTSGPTRPSGAAPGSWATWTVRPGDDLWSIAVRVVTSSGADSCHVAGYWTRLIEANRDRLPVPADPSLIFPGDVLVLPPPGN